MPVDVKITNNAFGQLTVGISPTDTTITVGAGEGARFPTLTGSEYFYATLADQSNLLEIVKVTARSTNTFTVLRGQDNTTAKSYTAGDRIELRPNAALFEDLIVQSRTADVITYDNNASGLTATDVQAAIDEVEGRVDSVETGKVAKTSDTGAALLPVGTTAERPASPEAGMMRFNTDEGYVEWYDDIFSEWFPTSLIPVFATGGTVTEITQDGVAYRVHTFTSDGAFEVVRGGEVEYLVVAGGGGGGGGIGTRGCGGGGAGGYLEDSTKVSANQYHISVGNGGQGELEDAGQDGENSVFDSIIAIGGGGGAGRNVGEAGRTGGSGGGGNGRGSAGGAGTSSQGNNGGTGDDSSQRSGGGGGAGQAGQDATTNIANGGDGLSSSINGTATFYAGGGGGANSNVDGGAVGQGGLGGGGNGSNRDTISATNAEQNTGGGGGGGGGANPDTSGGDGGSGIVIVRYRIG